MHIASHIKKNLDMYFKMHYNIFMNKEKSKIIQVRVTPEEKTGLVEAAKISGIPLSSWVRERLRLSAIRELEGAGRRVPFVESVPIKEDDNHG
jgi:hypothetical protein